jgi:hypothetical protein
MGRKELLDFLGTKGEYRHFCPDWDYDAIDETCGEFECCLCDKAKIKEMNSGDTRNDREVGN